MHSNRMRTARSLPWEVSVIGVFSVQWVFVWSVSVRETPFPCGQTDTCEIITLPQTSFAGGKNTYGLEICKENGSDK